MKKCVSSRKKNSSGRQGGSSGFNMLLKTEDLDIALFCSNPQAGSLWCWRMATGAIRLHANLARDMEEREQEGERGRRKDRDTPKLLFLEEMKNFPRSI